MLEVKGLTAGYGDRQVLFDVDLDVAAGEVVCIMGRNGAGKTTTVKGILGLVDAWEGTVAFNAEAINQKAVHKIARLGIGYVPQGRGLFGELSVKQNLEIGWMAGRQQGSRSDQFSAVYALFPRLLERQNQEAGTLSGGEQQMLAMARALCVQPKLLAMDEPSEGLQPSMITMIHDVIAKVTGEGVAVLLVEQRVDAMFAVADNVVFLENGRSVAKASVDALRADQSLIHRHLGVS